MRAVSLLLFGVLFVVTTGAHAMESGAAPAIMDCRSAAAVYEQSAGLPSGLLLAIGQVESGRLNPATGRIEPWPWATNHAGEGRYFASAEDAIAWVTAQQAFGVQSIDVGCFQVNLYYHPDAFASLAEAFDPAANAHYAASFLNRLRDQSGSWPSAIALYHSADPFEGQRYSMRVMAAWNGGLGIAAAPATESIRAASPVVVRLAAAASIVRVVVPDWAIATSAASVASLPVSIGGLPRVIAPGR